MSVSKLNCRFFLSEQMLHYVGTVGALAISPNPIFYWSLQSICKDIKMFGYCLNTTSLAEFSKLIALQFFKLYRLHFFGPFSSLCWKLKEPAPDRTLWRIPFGRWYGYVFNPLNPKLNPISYLLALLAHHFLHVSRIRVKSLTLRLLMSYIYGVPILDVSRSHTTTQHSR